MTPARYRPAPDPNGPNRRPSPGRRCSRAALFPAAHAPADMTGQFINLFGADDFSGHVPGPI